MERLDDGGGGRGGKGARGRRPRLTLSAAQRLKGAQRVDEVYKTGQRRIAHPLAVHGLRREDNGPSRVGISIGRRVGGAVERNRIKRRLREAYRLMQGEFPEGFDWLIVVRPHKVLEVAQYQDKLRHLLR